MSTTSSARDYAAKDSTLPSGLPAKVRIHEVAPRDGFQLEPKLIQTAEKI
jgi:hypothetical protein